MHTFSQQSFLPKPAAVLHRIIASSIILLLLVCPSVAFGQNGDSPSVPIPAADELVAIAGGYGTVLYTAGGTVVAPVAAGDRLVAVARSADDHWLLVRTSNGAEGWAERTSLLLFERISLPMIDLDVTAMNDAVAEAAARSSNSSEINANEAEPQESSTGTSTGTPSADVVTDSEEGAEDGEKAAVVEADAEASSEPATEIAADTKTIPALVRTGDQRLNVRSGPGLQYPVIGKAAPGATVMAIGRNADQSWLQIRQEQVAEGYGWVATQLVAVTEPVSELPLASAVHENVTMSNVTMSAGTADMSPTSTATENIVAMSAQPAGLAGKLVLLDRNGGTIYLYNLASGALQPLTSGNDPALSPDGSQIVFTRGGGENGIYLIGVDGSNERQIFGERELLRSPKWSPDGQWIVFSRGDEFNKCYLDEDTGECLRFTPFFTEGLETGKDHVRKLARIDVNGDNYRDLAVVPDAFAPDWGSGGVVYQSAAGLQITQDTPEDNNRLLYFEIRRQYHQDPDWQGNGGGRIIFQQRQGSHYEIFAINSDGGGLTALTRPATALVDQMPSNVSPAWSPDGQSIVFLSNRTAANEAGAWRLWVMNADGSNQRPLPVFLPLHYDYALEQMVDWGP